MQRRSFFSLYALPALVFAVLLLAWDLTVHLTGSSLFPTPLQVLMGTIELVQSGVLAKYIVASLFRVTWGFAIAVLIGVPVGLVVGWYSWAHHALNPLIQILRPISPIAWIPIAILLFGVQDTAPIFIILLASVFPIIVSTAAGVKQIESKYLRAATNFELSHWQLMRSVVIPGTLPHIVTGMRIALGVAWLVVVAAEMIAVNSGLGYLIIDARNAGKRYDLVVAGMILIGLIGFGLDQLLKRIERLKALEWGYSHDH